MLQEVEKLRSNSPPGVIGIKHPIFCFRKFKKHPDLHYANATVGFFHGGSHTMKDGLPYSTEDLLHTDIHNLQIRAASNIFEFPNDYR